ncbi:MAG TPA: PIG-L family deacetylase [Bacteroidota bacterium]|nr:PIG-L family deacetylase [Bacteroidota bacterium]
MIKRIVLLFALGLLCFGAAVNAATKKDPPNLVLMCLSAHPDDEDGAALAYYAKLRGVKTYSIFFTRGEGGQNEIGSALYGELGAVRTKETLDAANILGSEAFFLGFPDFGFSKTALETMTKWGGDPDTAEARLVFMIRALKPDVIITNHDTVTTLPNRAHGNHQLVGIVAMMAFADAADSTYHPEMLRGGLTTWQVKKLYVRSFGRIPVPQDSLISIDVTKKLPSGETIEEVSLDALHCHRSQGLDHLTLASMGGFRSHRYILFKSDSAYARDSTDLFSGIKPSLRKAIALPKTMPEPIPKFSIRISPEYLIWHALPSSPKKTEQKITLTLINNFDEEINVDVNGGEYKHEFTIMPNKTADHTIEFPVVASGKMDPRIMEITAVPSSSGGESLAAYTAKAKVTIVPSGMIVPPKINVGLVKTYDNTNEETLRTYGVPYTLLDSAALASADLSKYTSIMLDLRIFEYRTDAIKYNKRLLEYAKNGGNLICFYHKTFDWNGKDYAPYPLALTAERVTEEDAKVTELIPDSPLLTIPNKIDSTTDWNNWVQERNLYLPSDDTAKTSPQYQRILAMSDDDEHQPSTSLLWARYGKGTYTYCSLALYRQLHFLQPGAVKLFLNMVSQPRGK